MVVGSGLLVSSAGTGLCGAVLSVLMCMIVHTSLHRAVVLRSSGGEERELFKMTTSVHEMVGGVVFVRDWAVVFECWRFRNRQPLHAFTEVMVCVLDV
jgi:hypothetical protein